MNIKNDHFNTILVCYYTGKYCECCKQVSINNIQIKFGVQCGNISYNYYACNKYECLIGMIDILIMKFQYYPYTKQKLISQLYDILDGDETK